MLKGILTFVPIVNAWRIRRSPPDGADSPRYCYSVWLRHLVTLRSFGFAIDGATVGELGPGDSIGVGLAALLSGASRYVGLDLVPFAAKSNLKKIFDELVQMYSSREPIPNHDELPSVRPLINSYKFPNDLIEWKHFNRRVDDIRRWLATSANDSHLISYYAPWSAPNVIAPNSLDLVFSQAVLEHVDALEDTYQTMFMWLKPGGYASNVIDFNAHRVAPVWNGHWAYSDWQWRLVRGRREFLLNREPLTTHLDYASKAGFEILVTEREEANGQGLQQASLSQRFQALEPFDARTRSALLIMRKPNNTKTGSPN